MAGLVTDIGVIRPRDMQDFPELYCTYQDHKDSHVFRKSKEWREWVEGKRLFDLKQKSVQSETSFVQWEKRPHYAPPESTRWVEVVGVFDTVGSLGIPEVEGIFNRLKVWVGSKVISVEKPGFHNVALSPCKSSISFKHRSTKSAHEGAPQSERPRDMSVGSTYHNFTNESSMRALKRQSMFV